MSGKMIRDMIHSSMNICYRPLINYFCIFSKSVGHIFVDVQDILCHALVATGRKYLRGPRGSGFLFLSSVIISDLWPSHIDHYGVPITKVPVYQDGDSVEDLLQYKPRAGASRFEFWESNVANRLGLGVAIKACLRVGPENIEKECRRLSKLLRGKLAEIPNVLIHHKSTVSCGIVTFYSTVLDSATVRKEMQKEGFELSVVPATSTPFDSAKTKVPDLVRVSLSYTNTPEEINAFVRSLKILLGA
jgi:selenocysteine lyase/cysteine desulfurase